MKSDCRVVMLASCVPFAFAGCALGGGEGSSTNATVDAKSSTEDAWASASETYYPTSDASAGGWHGGGPGTCVPACDGKQCGPDGCGGSCGWCPGTLSCKDATCQEVPGCKPDCAGKMSGVEDGCGGVCCGSGMGIGLKPGGAQDAGYFRRLVGEGEVPDPAFLPIEGWLNEHDTPLPQPDEDKVITLHGMAAVFYDPRDEAPLVALQLGMNSGISPATIAGAHFNLAVVVDRSGSMAEENKLEYVKAGLQLMVDSLDEEDRLAIVIYDDQVQVLYPSQPVADRAEVKQLIGGLYPGNTTNLHGGMVAGYEQVESAMDAMPGAQHRVILLSDGIANFGALTDNAGIVAASKPYGDKGIGITTIGVGSSFNFDLMYSLANQGRGNFYFIDSPQKLLDVFVEEIRYLLTPVADNLKIWFRLPAEFGVDSIYGFEFKQAGDDWVITGPAAQYDVTPAEEKPPAGDPGDVTVSTVFASRKNGIVFVKIRPPGLPGLKALEGGVFATVSYAYTLVDAKKEEAASVDVPLGSYAFDTDGQGFQYFSGDIVRRNLCILRLGLAMKRACEDFHGDAAAREHLATDLVQFDHTRAFCEESIAGLEGWSEDHVKAVTGDLDLLGRLQTNIQAAWSPGTPDVAPDAWQEPDSAVQPDEHSE